MADRMSRVLVLLDALFAEQCPDGPFAKELLLASGLAAGLRCVVIGEDGEYVVFLGHPARDDVVDAAQAIGLEWGIGADSDPSVDDFEYTFGRLLTRCPDHTRPNEDCTYCVNVTSEEWWLDWSAGREAAGRPEYMPITVWSVQ